MAAKSIVLSVGDYPAVQTDFVDLVDGNNFICPPEDGFEAPPPAVHRYHSRTKGTLLTTEDFRIITMKLKAFGGPGAGSADTLLSNIGKLERKGRQARLASGVTPRGTPVSLAVRINGATNYTWFDVQDIRITAAAHLWGPVQAQEITVELTCLPWGRGPVIADVLSPTLVNGSPGYLFRAGVLGDTDAVAQLTVVDVSTAGFINRLHVGRMAGEGLLVSDHSPIQRIFPGGAATQFSDASALFGTTARLTTTPNFSLLGAATMPAGAFQSGSFHAYLACRDNGSFAQTPTLPTATPTNHAGGALVLGQFSVLLASVDSSGYESLATTPIALSLTGTQNAITVTWTAGANAQNTAIYLLSGATYYRYTVAAGLGTFTILLLSGTTGSNPPTINAAPTLNSLTAQAGGTLAADTYNVVVSMGTASPQNGQLSAQLSVTVTANQEILVNVTQAAGTAVVWVQQQSTGLWFQATQGNLASGTYNYTIASWSNNASAPVTFVAAPTGLTNAAVAGGSLGVTTWGAVIASVDANGTIGFSTASVNATTTAANATLHLSWTPNGSAIYQYLYLTGTGGVWRFVLGGTVSNLFVGSTTPAPLTNLSTLGNALLYGAAGVAGVAEQDLPGKPVLTKLGGSQWELLYLGLYLLPPVHTPNGQAVPPWVFNVYARSGVVSNNVVDVAALILIAEDEPHFLAEYRGLQNQQLCTWLLDDPKDRYQSAVLYQAGVAVGAAAARGELRLSPGNNLLPILAEGVNGLFDTQNLKYQASLRYVPLYGFLRGGDADKPVSDSFNRANSVSALGTADSGQTYSVTGGTFGVSTNRFYVNTVSTANKAFAYLNSPELSGVIRATLVNTGAGISYLVFRMADAANWYAVQYGATQGLTLVQCVAGTISTVASNARNAVSGDQLAVTLAGTTCSVAVNGVTLIAGASIPNNPTAPAIGLGGNNAATETFDDWSFQSA